ncbi:MAG: hypothetical protein JW870_15445 [Candidatus Delongbacteria bacterium]|nr:hypothetical protein [Candidatus Delongbacteria bacterium]
MKKHILILVLTTLLISCNVKGNQERILISKDSNSKTETLNQTKSDSISSKEYGQLILNGDVKPTDNELTYNCLLELIAENQTDLDFYFSVYREISKNADGALSEMLCGITKTFFELNPDFCIEKLKSFESKEKNSFLEYIAYEFYASGIDYAAEISEYIERAEKKLRNRSHSNLDTLKEIKGQLIVKAKRMNE